MRKNLKEAILNPTPKNIKKVDKSEFKDDRVYGQFGRYRDYMDFDEGLPDLRSAIAERARAVSDRYEEQLLENLRRPSNDYNIGNLVGGGYIQNDDGTQVRYRRFNGLEANREPIREGQPWEARGVTDALSRRETPQDRIARMREEIARRRNVGPEPSPNHWTREWLRDMDHNNMGEVYLPPHMQSDEFSIVITRPRPGIMDPLHPLSMESTVGIKYRNVGRYAVCTDTLTEDVIRAYASELVTNSVMIQVSTEEFERAMERVLNENNIQRIERN